MAANERYYPLALAARKIGCGRSSLNAKCIKGTVKSIVIHSHGITGTKRLIPESEIERLIEERRKKDE